MLSCVVNSRHTLLRALSGISVPFDLQLSTFDYSASISFASYPFRTLASHFQTSVSSISFEIKRFRTLCKIPGIGYPPPSPKAVAIPLRSNGDASIPFLFVPLRTLSLTTRGGTPPSIEESRTKMKPESIKLANRRRRDLSRWDAGLPDKNGRTPTDRGKALRYRGQDQAGKMNSPLQVAEDQGRKDLTSAEGRRRPRIWARVGAMARMSMRPREWAAGMPGPRMKKEAFISG